MFGLKRFGDVQLERLYTHQQLHHHGAVLVYVLCVFTAALLLLALNHLPSPDMTLLLATVSAACALALNILLNIQSAAHQHRTVVAIGCWLSITVLCMLPAGGQHALLPVIIAHFALYTLFPFGIFPTLGVCCMLSLAQITTFILLPSQSVFSLEQLLATILVHVWSHFIGVYMFSTRNRLCRAVFLNARNALSSEQEAVQENAKMATLLSSALPSHVITSVQSQLGASVPKIYVEQYGQVSVVYAKFYGLQAILNQISVQDSARLLNEFNTRIDQLVKRYGFVRIQSDAILVLSGVPQFREDNAVAACHFSRDLITLFRSFCDATMADLQLKVGVGSGSISSGIIGAKKWHYDVIGIAFDNAKQLESKAYLGSIIISEDTKKLVDCDFATERIDHGSWCLVHVLASSPSLVTYSKLLPSLLFPANQRRFSLVTLPQAINRVLQSSNLAANEANLIKVNSTNSTQPGRRKKKNINLDPLCEKFDDEDMENDGLIKLFSMKFLDQQLEKSFHMQMDRWFIPALAISILFLVVYGLYQLLVMPRLITTLALIILALAVMFIVLLMLYINYFESFCHFITRTSAGHSVAILLIFVVLFMCGIVNTFSCPSFSVSPVCHVIHYSLLSCAIWMLTTAVFVRFSSLYLLATLVSAILVYSIHVFATHADLYLHFSIAVGWRVEFDLLVGLVTLSMLIFLQSRRNERMIRLDYLSVLKTVEDNRQLERFEYLNEQIILNSLPIHIAHNYGLRAEPYHHLCHTVGILSAKFGNGSDWQGEFGFDRLNRIIYEVDQLIELHTGLEKVRSSHCIYTAAVGVLPEVGKNVNDAPFTIGDLLASLTVFAAKVKQIGDNEGVDTAIGIDCGSALSLVVGVDRPRYEVVGLPCTKAAKLMEAAASMFHQKENRTMVSEEIFLALRPRANFHFDEKNPVTVSPALIGYMLIENYGQRCANVLPATKAAQQRLSIQSNQNVVLPVCSMPSQQVNEPNVEDSSAESTTDFDDADEADQFIEDSAFLPDYGDHTQSTTIAMDKSQCSLVLPSDLQALANDARINGFYGQIPTNASSSAVDNLPNRNPLEMFASMNSSFSSEMYSIDVSVETDSEMEWITPDMIANNSDYRGNYSVLPAKNIVKNNNRRRIGNQAGSSVPYKGDRARQYSDFSESERPGPGNFSSRMRRKRYRPSLSRNGPKLPSWLSSRTSFNSELSISASQAGSISALDRLNAAARRVDKMLQELAVVDKCNANLPECAPFPTANGTANGVVPSVKDLHQQEAYSSSKREMSSTCQTEYDNADSDCAYSDPEIVNTSRLEQTKGRLDDLKQALICSKSSKDNQQFRCKPHLLKDRPPAIEGSALSQITNNRRFDNGSEADIDSNCSSIASSMMFDKLKWKSVHSIGYENEYEFASEDEEDVHSSAATELSGILGFADQGSFVPSSNQPAFEPMDAEPEQDLEIGAGSAAATSFRPYTASNQRGGILDARGAVTKLSRDIRKNFGEYQLASFSDIEN